MMTMELTNKERVLAAQPPAPPVDRKCSSYHASLMKALRDPAEAFEYILAARQESVDAFKKAVANVHKAQSPAESSHPVESDESWGASEALCAVESPPSYADLEGDEGCSHGFMECGYKNRAEKAEAIIASLILPERTEGAQVELPELVRRECSLCGGGIYFVRGPGDIGVCRDCWKDKLAQREAQLHAVLSREAALKEKTVDPGICVCGKPIWGEGWNPSTGQRFFSHVEDCEELHEDQSWVRPARYSDWFHAPRSWKDRCDDRRRAEKAEAELAAETASHKITLAREAATGYVC